MAQELLTLQNLAKYYTSAQSVVVGLNQLNLTFRRGEFVAVTGESGSGKSTLAHVLGGILPYEGGELLYKGKPTSHYDSGDWERYRRDCVSFISQSYGILPGSSVLDNVTCALRLVGLPKERLQQSAEAILKKVDLWDLRRRRAAKLSSGQKQRLSIARALAKPAPILIADEPTGNLDAENSAMVISLLAEAAKDRLVILITHEFSEAEDYATRHIELHDGRVTMDAQLREAPEAPSLPPEEKRTAARDKKGLSWFVARFQIKARPVWGLLMLCLFALTVFAMFAFSGTFISNLDDTFTYYYDNSAFRNGNDRRIAVARPGGGDFTAQELEQIRSIPYVEAAEVYGYVTDIQYAYREGVDYEIKTTLEAHGSLDVTYVPVSYYSLVNTQGQMPFLRTVSILPKGEGSLTAGRLPESAYEVVAAGGEELLGEKITVLLQDQKKWSSSTFIRMEVTVVGVTDYGSHLYFHSDLGRVMLASARADFNYLYMPMPPQPNMLGQEVTTTNGTVLYKIISNGTLAGDDELAAGVRQQATQWIVDTIKWTDEFLRDFTLDEGNWADKYTNLNWLGYYAEDWGVDSSPILEFRKEIGIDNESLNELETSQRHTLLNKTLSDPEVIARAKTVAEPLFRELKEVYTREKQDFLALDVNRLTLEEAVALLEKWGGTKPNIRPIQKGEIVISDGLMTGIMNDLSRGKREMTREERAMAIERADFAVYPFPNMGILRDMHLTQITMEVLKADERKPLKDMKIIGLADVGYSQVIFLHPEDFDEMIYPGTGDQISVFAEDYAYVDRVLAQLRGMGYAAISPYQEGAVTQNPELAQQRMQTLRVCIIALLAVIVLQILLLRAMFSMETESYRLLSHIGLNCVTAQRSVLWQIMLFALGGQVVGVGIITACAALGMAQVVTILRYLPLSYRLGLCLVHLCASALTAAWTMKSLKKQVFPQAGAEPDLDWDVLGEEVEA